MIEYCAACGKHLTDRVRRRWLPHLRQLWLVLFEGEEPAVTQKGKDEVREYKYICGPCRSRLHREQARGCTDICSEHSASIA
jgi:hypothetical protein